ncbi:MAG TPA: beta-propeller fold lactonase family protein, partial [Chitinophagales bacterium]|nr:beta-propeller fold lactonase family protein [Chitinophagales bacterium]
AKYVWVTNYRMYGDGFANPGDDDCGSKGGFDSSFVYRVDTKTLRVDAAVSAGSVPKYIAITPDNKYVLVSNWCSGDMSVINLLQMKEVRRIKLGLYPRGIAVDSKSQHVYVAIMGSDKIARVNLHDFTVRMLEHIGRRPRHLCVSSDDKFLFASLNGEHKVVKIDLSAKKVIASVKTGLAPRSMTLSPDNQFLYVVNYGSGNLSVIRTADMRVAQNVATKTHPIGVAYDPETDNVWVACYSGCIQVFENVQEDVPVPASVRNSEPDFQYHIIVGAFRQEQNLKKMMSRCVKAGYKPYVVKSNGALKKLSCKGFDDKESALNELSKLKELFGEGIWILKQPMMTQAAASQSSN